MREEVLRTAMLLGEEAVTRLAKARAKLSVWGGSCSPLSSNSLAWPKKPPLRAMAAVISSVWALGKSRPSWARRTASGKDCIFSSVQRERSVGKILSRLSVSSRNTP